MAEEKKDEKKAGRGERLYGKSPKIVPEGKEEAPGGEAGGGDAAKVGQDAAPAPAATGDTTTEGDVMAGTDGIETNHTQSGERMEMHGRHMREHDEVHHRHEREHLMRAMGHSKEGHKEMSDRHHAEVRSMHTRHERDMRDMAERHTGEGPQGGITEESKGKSGTEAK